MFILGINAYHGDAAAALIKDGRIVAAVEEERFNRVKHCAGFPAEAVRYCLREAGIGLEDVAHVGVSRDPSAHLHKKILFAASRAAKQIGGRSRRQTAERPTADGRRQTADGADVVGVGSVEVAEIGEERSRNGKEGNGKRGGNGRGPGIFRQVKDRLNNAAKVRDLKDDLARALGVSKGSCHAQFHNIEHHRAHLASSFYVSPFERAALLSIDGFGDFVSTMWAVGEGNSIEVLDQVEYPHSTGIVYTATTQFLGFPHYGDEGKVMGLAPYGKPHYIEEFRDIIRTGERGQFRLNLDYFRHHAEGVDMTWDQGSPVIGRIFSDEFVQTFGPAREPGAPLSDRERDIAASLQRRLEEVGFHVLNHLHAETGLTDLGLSGGVAYNSVMNGKILLNTPFRRVYVQPAAGDSGTALGVCYEIHNRISRSAGSDVKQSVRLRSAGSGSDEAKQAVHLPATTPTLEESGSAPPQTNSLRYNADGSGNDVKQSVRLRSDGNGSDDVKETVRFRSDVETREESGSAPPQTNSLRYNADASRYVMLGAYTGPEFSNEEIKAELEISDLSYETHSDRELTARAAQDIADGLVVGWFQGRMEFGPRALGNRSIVVDPRRAEMKDILNDRIKKREPFRPFAPSILEERTADYFEQSHPAPTMLMVYQVRPERRREIPAVTHVDGSGRLQTVSRELNSRYYQLISDFNDLTGVPVVLNTSFNENEPIVCTPRHAIDCFLKTRMDVLYLGNHSVRRTN